MLRSATPSHSLHGTEMRHAEMRHAEMRPASTASTGVAHSRIPYDRIPHNAGKPTTKVPAVEGLVHWARLDLAVLRLSADGRYTLSYRYSQDVVDTRVPMKLPPARDELSVGRYSDRGRTLTFVPNRTKQGSERTVTAQVVGADIFLDKTVFVGERPFRVRLLFRRDPSLW
jgi:hypothetical protein